MVVPKQIGTVGYRSCIFTEASLFFQTHLHGQPEADRTRAQENLQRLAINLQLVTYKL
jgi:hypothetical protein